MTDLSEDAASDTVKLNLLFVGLSLAIAAVPFFLVKLGFLGTGLLVGLVGASVWLFIFVHYLLRQGRRAYWFLLLAPVGLFWPAFLIRWFYGSMVGDPHWMMP